MVVSFERILSSCEFNFFPEVHNSSYKYECTYV